MDTSANTQAKNRNSSQNGPSTPLFTQEQFKKWFKLLLGPWTLAYLGIFALGIYLYIRYLGSPIPDEFRSMLNSYENFQASGRVYRLSDFHGFKLPPIFLVLIGLLPQSPQAAWEVHLSASILALMVSLALGARYRTHRELLFLAAGLWLSWGGLNECLSGGHLETFCLLLTLISCVLFTRYTLAAGLIAGFLPWIRFPYLILSLAFLLASARRRRVLTGDLASFYKPPSQRMKDFFSGMFFGWIVAGAVVPALAFGPEVALELTQNWMDVLKSQPYLWVGDPKNQSLWVSLGTVFKSYPNLSVGVSAILSGWLVGAMLVRRPYAPTAQDAFSWVSPWLLLIHLLNPVSFIWAQTSLVGLTFAVFRTGRRILTLRLFMYLGAAVLAFAIGRGLEAVYQVSTITLLQVLLLLLSV